jgi:hypothetical protein
MRAESFPLRMNTQGHLVALKTIYELEIKESLGDSGLALVLICTLIKGLHSGRVCSGDTSKTCE